MGSGIELELPLTLTQFDCTQIRNYFKDSPREKVLLLCTEGNILSPDKISGMFKFDDNFVGASTEAHIKFSSGQVISCIMHCSQHQKGLVMIHNHKVGNTFSKSDMKTEAQLLLEIAKQQLPTFHFMVLDMETQILSGHTYAKCSDNYKLKEWSFCIR